MAQATREVRNQNNPEQSEYKPQPVTCGIKIVTYASATVTTINAMLIAHANTLNPLLFTCEPISSLRFTSSRISTITNGSQIPLATCDNTKIFRRGAWGIRMTPPPSTINAVYRP